jgi:hypothetical protein
VRPLIGFSDAKNIRTAEIHGQIVKAYVEGVMYEGNVRKRCRLFKEGRTNVQDEERSGWLCLVADDLKANVKAEIGEDGRFTIYELYQQFCGRPQSEKWPETKDVVPDWLKGLPAMFISEGIQKLVPR